MVGRYRLYRTERQLFCASEGLATVFRGAVDYDKLGHTMKLGEGQFVTFAQTVGYPRA